LPGATSASATPSPPRSAGPSRPTSAARSSSSAIRPCAFARSKTNDRAFGACRDRVIFREALECAWRRATALGGWGKCDESATCEFARFRRPPKAVARSPPHSKASRNVPGFALQLTFEQRQHQPRRPCAKAPGSRRARTPFARGDRPCVTHVLIDRRQELARKRFVLSHAHHLGVQIRGARI